MFLVEQYRISDTKDNMLYTQCFTRIGSSALVLAHSWGEVGSMLSQQREPIEIGLAPWDRFGRDDRHAGGGGDRLE